MAVEMNKTLLLVEDEALIALALQKELEKYGYNVLTVHTGEKAIKIFQSTSSIDLILMDIDLGKGLDGTETAEIILKTIEIPIIFVSSHTEPEIVEKTENITSYGYVVKNSSITVLDASIKMAFKLFEVHAKLNVNEEKFETFTNQATEGITVADMEGNYTFVNPAFCKMSGYSETELLKLTVFDMKAQNQTHASFYESKKTMEGVPITVNLQKKDGTEYLTEIIGKVIKVGNKDLVLGTIRDISSRQKIEDQLKYERDNLKNIFEAMVDGVYIVDQNLDVQYVNPVLIKDFGDYKGLKCHKYFYNRDEACPWCKYGAILEGNTVRWEGRLPNTDKIYDLIETPIKNSDGSISKLKIFRDISDQKRAENEIKRQLLEKETILKEVHHRIKNNFTSIGNLLSLQLSTLSNKEAISALQDAIGRVQSMKILYEKLLITSDYKVTSIREYLSNLLDEIVNLFSDSKIITMEINIDDFQLDSRYLVPVGIIVNELLTNIFKYAFQGKDSGIIKVLLNEKSGKINLIISDNGIGLPKEFDINEQTGFGLMLVKMLSEQLFGSFSIENNKGTISKLEFSI